MQPPLLFVHQIVFSVEQVCLQLLDLLLWKVMSTPCAPYLSDLSPTRDWSPSMWIRTQCGSFALLMARCLNASSQHTPSDSNQQFGLLNCGPTTEPSAVLTLMQAPCASKPSPKCTSRKPHRRISFSPCIAGHARGWCLQDVGAVHCQTRSTSLLPTAQTTNHGDCPQSTPLTKMFNHPPPPIISKLA